MENLSDCRVCAAPAYHADVRNFLRLCSFSGLVNGVIGTSYTSEDSDLVAVENNYAAKENDLQSRIDNIERDYPGYDEYRYNLAYIGHNPMN